MRVQRVPNYRLTTCIHVDRVQRIGPAQWACATWIVRKVRSCLRTGTC